MYCTYAYTYLEGHEFFNLLFTTVSYFVPSELAFTVRSSYINFGISERMVFCEIYIHDNISYDDMK